MYKKEWIKPQVEVVNFTTCDVIATSGEYKELDSFSATIEGEG